MTTMIDLKCKNCGAPLPLDTAVDNVVKCRYCTSTFTLPKNESEPAAVDAIRMGNMELDNCAFDRAATAFKKAIELDGDEPEGFMGLALATHRVQYLKDGVNNCLQPICHEISKDDFTKDTNYRLALSTATDTQRNEYRRKGEEIDKIRKEFYALKQSGLDYDCFICVKVTGEDGKPTSDSHEALKIYHHLKDQGYKPFYSEEEIRGRAGAEYEALILYALRTSECMLIVCGNEEYLQTKWVKNEYTRFQSLINDEDKERDSITIVFSGRPIERLPGRDGKIQGIDLSKPDAYTRISKYVEDHTPQARQRKADEANRKATEEAERNRIIAEMQRKQEEARLEMEQALRALKNNGSEAQQQRGNNTLSLMKRAKQFLDGGDFDSAKEYYDRVLDIDPENGEAWFGCFLSENNASNESKLVGSFAVEKSIASGMNYNNAKKYASGELKERIAKFESEFESAAGERRAKRYLAENFEIVGTELRKYKGKGGAVVIPDSVTSIGEYAFYKCESRTFITIPNGVTSITIPDSVTSIGEYAFYKCDSLTSVTIGNSVTSVCKEAFAYCNSLTSVTIGNSVTSIGDWAFGKCSSLTSITIPNSVTSIGDMAFSYCSSLTSITIPNSVTSIGEYAFSDCGSLTSVTIGSSVTSIGGNVFYNCSSLTTVNWNAVACASTDSTTNLIFNKCSKLTTVYIANNVRTIPSCLFFDCDSLTSVTMGNSVTSIGNRAFAGCHRLKSITIPKGITSIKGFTFSGCNSLMNVVIPNGVTSIGDYAFSYCSSLSSVTIPNSVTSIGESAFYCNCSRLLYITFQGTKVQWNAITKGKDWFYRDGSYTVYYTEKSGFFANFFSKK